jgi:hypothetical protein
MTHWVSVPAEGAHRPPRLSYKLLANHVCVRMVINRSFRSAAELDNDERHPEDVRRSNITRAVEVRCA